jgi:hypothetical protein
VRSEGNMSLKIPVTPLGINPGTVRLVGQRLNQYATPNVMQYRNEWTTVDSCTVTSVGRHVCNGIAVSR